MRNPRLVGITTTAREMDTICYWRYHLAFGEIFVREVNLKQKDPYYSYRLSHTYLNYFKLKLKT